LSTFLKVVIADLNELVAALIQSPKGGGELIFDNSLHNLYPARPEALLGQQEASQLCLHSWKEKNISWCDIQ
jgi:hypothetical protein